MLWNFDFLERIIKLNLENNQKIFQELQNRIFGKILSTIASSLLSIYVHANGEGDFWNDFMYILFCLGEW